MKIVQKLLLGLMLGIGVISSMDAQAYNTAIGGRFGYFNGFTVKHFMKSDKAVEGLLSWRWDGFVITGLYEYQRPFAGARNLNWYIGIGGHVGVWDEDAYYYNQYHDNYTVVGLDLIGGLEYNFSEVPIGLGLDWKPSFNFIGDDHVWMDGIALSVRYTFR